MAEDLAASAVPQWIAPAWAGHWGRTGAFVEHPVGHLALAAVLVRLGASGTAAVGTLNVAGWGFGLVLLGVLARRVGAAPRRAQALWAASPLFVQYLLRGNQEHPLAACALAAMAAVSGRPKTLRAAGAAALGYAAAGAAGLALKGVAGLAIVPLALLAVLCVPAGRSRTYRVLAWAAGSLGLVAAVAAYLAAYRQVTGTDFWRLHLAQQLAHSVGSGLRPARKLQNLAWYLVRLPWYGLPAVAALAHDVWRRGPRAACRPAARRLGLGAAACIACGFALADRKADRYLFVAYPLLALAAAAPGAPAPRRGRGVVRALQVVETHLGPFLGVAVAGKLVASRHAYVFVRWLPGA